MIRAVKIEDAKDICEIYNYYVKNTIITFEEKPVQQSEMKNRIAQTTKALPWLVYDNGQKIVGYAYASEWKSRCAYKHSVESTVYLQNGESGNGIGSLLYQRLIDQLKAKKYHAAIGGISLPNEASIALHEKIGFEKIGQFREVGNKFDKWIDVGYWELILK